MTKKTTTIGTSTRQTTLDTTAVETADLTREEELVIRMRYGVGVTAGTQLDLRGQAHAETRAKLAMIERAALDNANESRPKSKKDKIIDRLKSL